MANRKLEKHTHKLDNRNAMSREPYDLLEFSARGVLQSTFTANDLYLQIENLLDRSLL